MPNPMPEAAEGFFPYCLCPIAGSILCGFAEMSAFGFAPIRGLNKDGGREPRTNCALGAETDVLPPRTRLPLGIRAPISGR